MVISTNIFQLYVENSTKKMIAEYWFCFFKSFPSVSKIVNETIMFNTAGCKRSTFSKNIDIFLKI